MGATNFDLVKANFFQGPTMAAEIPATTGNVFWVSSTKGSNGNNGQSPASPVATTAAAELLLTPDNGDVVVWMENHAETFSAAAGVVLSVAGVTYVTLGSGLDKATFTFGSNTAASMDVTGNDCRILGYPIGLSAIDGLTKPFNITGNNFFGQIEWRDASDTVEAATAVRLDTADNAELHLIYKGFTTGNAAVRPVAVDDSDNVKVYIEGYGVVSTAWVNMVDAASTNVRVEGTLYTQGVTNFTRDVVDTIGGSTWSAEIFDASFGGKISGGSAAALASDDISAVATSVAAVGAVADAAVADTVEGAGMTTQSLVSDLKAALQRIGADSGNNTAATTLVADNRDGSLLERTETIIATLRDDVASNYIGIDNADNTASTATVVANLDGSVLERLEALMDPLSGYNPRMGFGVTKVSNLADGAGTDNLFTVTGRVLITSLTGEVTTIVGGAATVKISDITNSVDLCAATTIDTDAVGTMYALTSIRANILNGTGAVPVIGSIPNITGAQQTDVAIVGDAQAAITLGQVLDAADTGNITWRLTYIPLIPGATVTAAA